MRHHRRQQTFWDLSNKYCEVIHSARKCHIHEATHFSSFSSFNSTFRCKQRSHGWTTQAMNDVDNSLVLVIENWSSTWLVGWLPKVCHYHTWKLQTLGTVNRHDLHSIDVAFDSPTHEFACFISGNQRNEQLKNMSCSARFTFSCNMQYVHHMCKVSNISFA